jgi:uncharacterized membrane protein YqjE
MKKLTDYSFALLFVFFFVSSLFQLIIFLFTNTDQDYQRFTNVGVAAVSCLFILIGVSVLKSGLEPKPVIKTRKRKRYEAPARDHDKDIN